MRIPVTLLSGYLGAGKTTAINRLLAGDHGRRIAVLVNDFGAVNIDAGLIRNQRDKTISLTNGCVCCSISDDLTGAIDDQVRRPDPPEHIVVEASGVADPTRIAGHLSGLPGVELDAVVALADTETVRARARDKYVGSLVARQIGSADLVVLNKVDLVAPELRRVTRAWLEDRFPDSYLIETRFGEIDPSLLIGPAIPEGRQRDRWEDLPPEVPEFSSSVWTAPSRVDLRTLEEVLCDLPEAIHRVKGIVTDASEGRRTLVHRVGQRLSLTSAPSDRQPSNAGQPANRLALVAIGPPGAIDEAIARLDRCMAVQQSA